VILPILPNQEYSQFTSIHLSKHGVVVVAISTISYLSYVLQKVTKGRAESCWRRCWGAYSSTVTTVVMARRAAREKRPHLFRRRHPDRLPELCTCALVILLALFNRQLMLLLYLPFLCWPAWRLASAGSGTRRADKSAQDIQREADPKNPLELMTAFLFAGLFLAMLVATR